MKDEIDFKIDGIPPFGIHGRGLIRRRRVKMLGK
jgi:hypothetical protein